MRYPVTPDGRYFLVRGRLWRCTDPGLDDATRAALTRELMGARRAKGVAMRAGDAEAREAARARVDAAKRALGERGPVWWADGAPDCNRRMARGTAYAAWAEKESQGSPSAALPTIQADRRNLRPLRPGPAKGRGSFDPLT